MSTKTCWVVFLRNRSRGFPTQREAERFAQVENAFAGREVASIKKVKP
jgi:hypothetical protein